MKTEVMIKEEMIVHSINYYLSKGMLNYEIWKNLCNLYGKDTMKNIGKDIINEVCNDARLGFSSNIEMI